MGKLKETAAGGSTGAGAIANTPSNRLGGMQTRMSLKKYMLDFYGRVTNRNKFGRVEDHLKGSISKISESAAYPYQLDDATSRMKSMQRSGMQQTGKHDDADSISYGVEDDMGNLMLVTVPLEQGEELERRVAQALADVLDYKKTGQGENKTLAELLYELKDEFTIIDAQFPTIPKDAVYNADEISLPEDNGNQGQDFPEETTGDEMGDEEGEMDDNEGTGDEEFPDDMEGDQDPEDEDIGDDFDEETEDKESLLTSVLSMLKTQNEKEIAQAKAEEEKAKERQAELALKASKKELESQEEMVAAQAEMEAEKDKEKRAKEMAELAKFNYKKKKGMSEGFSPMFKSTLLELDSEETTRSIRQQMTILPSKYQPEPGDTPEQVRHKRRQQQFAMRELRTQLRAAQNRENYEQRMQRQGNEDELDDQGEEPTSQNRQQQQTRTNDQRQQ